MLCLLGGLLLPLILCVLGLEISQRHGKCLEDSMNPQYYDTATAITTVDYGTRRSSNSHHGFVAVEDISSK